MKHWNLKRLLAGLLAAMLLLTASGVAEEDVISELYEAEVAELGEVDLFDLTGSDDGDDPAPEEAPNLFLPLEAGEAEPTEEELPEDAVEPEDAIEPAADDGAFDIGALFAAEEADLPEEILPDADIIAAADEAPVGLKLDREAVALGVKETCALAVTADPAVLEALGPVVFSSDCPETAGVNAAGLVTGLQAGEAVITATLGEYAVQCAVTVLNAPAKVTLTPTAATLGEGETIELDAQVPEGSAGRITYTSSKPKVASVDPETGLVMALVKGSATITAEAYNGKKATCKITVKPAPTSLTLSETAMTLSVGQRRSVTVSLNKGEAGGFELVSGNPAVAGVEANCIVAMAPGEVKVSARAYNDVQAPVQVTVVPAPEYVELDDTITIGLGEKLTLKARTENDAPADLTWTSSDATVAEISNGGAVTAKKAGEATIRVETQNGREASCRLVVLNAPAKVTLTPAAATLGEGETIALDARVPEGSAGRITYTSNKPKVASVDPETGLVTAHGKGSATITAKAYNGKKASCKITVKPAPTSLTLSETAMTLSVGQRRSVTVSLNKGEAGGFELVSGNPAVAGVETNCIVAMAPGEAEVSARAYNDVQAPVQVTVVPAPEYVELDDTITIGLGEKLTLKARTENDAPADLTWTSSDASVAEIAGGAVTAKKAGEATIRVETQNGREASCRLVVLNAPAKVTLTPAAATLGEGETLELDARVPEGSAGRITYTSSKPKVASVDPETGLVTAHGKGSATITAKAYNGKKATCKITVKPAPKTLDISPAETTLGVGQTVTFTAKLDSGAAGAVTVESDDESVASAEGRSVTGIAPGTARITARTFNELPARKTATVTVLPAPTFLSLNADSLTLGVGERFALEAAIDEGAHAGIGWHSDDSAVASVSGSGVITPRKAGSATITATTHNGLTASVAVTVKKAPGKVTLTPSSLTMQVGDVYALEAATPDGTVSALNFSSARAGVASVDARTGTVIAHAQGTARITVQTFNGKKAYCTVTVGPMVTRPDVPRGVTAWAVSASAVQVSWEQASRAEGYRVYLSRGGSAADAELYGDYGVDARSAVLRGLDADTGWTVYVTAVNAIGESLLSGAASAWAATPAAAAAPEGDPSGAADEVKLTYSGVIMMAVGAQRQLTARVTPSGDVSNLAWQTTSDAIIGLSPDGAGCEVTALKAGTATVSVELPNGASAAVTIMAVDTDNLTDANLAAVQKAVAKHEYLMDEDAGGNVIWDLISGRLTAAKLLAACVQTAIDRVKEADDLFRSIYVYSFGTYNIVGGANDSSTDYYYYKNNTLYFRPYDEANYSYENFAYVLLHESGHAVDYNYGGNRTFDSLEQDAYEALMGDVRDVLMDRIEKAVAVAASPEDVDRDKVVDALLNYRTLEHEQEVLSGLTQDEQLVYKRLASVVRTEMNQKLLMNNGIMVWDAIEGATNYAIAGKFGHSYMLSLPGYADYAKVYYYTREGVPMLTNEPWAEFFSANLMHDEKTLDLNLSYLPETCAYFTNVLASGMLNYFRNLVLNR